MNKVKLFIKIFIISLFLVGCAKIVNENDLNLEVDNNTVDQSNEFYKSNEQTFEIETEYCSLYYPSKWKESIIIEINKTDYYSVEFSTSLNNENIKLFSIIFNEENRGNKLGVLSYENLSVPVSYIDYSDNFPDGLSNEENDQLSIMYEDINVVISNLVYVNNMVLSK